MFRKKDKVDVFCPRCNHIDTKRKRRLGRNKYVYKCQNCMAVFAACFISKVGNLTNEDKSNLE